MQYSHQSSTLIFEKSTTLYGHQVSENHANIYIFFVKEQCEMQQNYGFDACICTKNNIFLCLYCTFSVMWLLLKGAKVSI